MKYRVKEIKEGVFMPQIRHWLFPWIWEDCCVLGYDTVEYCQKWIENDKIPLPSSKKKFKEKVVWKDK